MNSEYQTPPHPDPHIPALSAQPRFEPDRAVTQADQSNCLA